DGDLELNLPGMRRHARFLLEGGVRAGNGVLLVCGGAGDFPTLHPDERIRVAEAVLDEVGGEVGVVLGAQSTDQRDVVALAQAAARLGAVAVQVSPPFYHPPTDDDVYEFVEAVASSADVGIVLYTTYWKGYQPPLELIERLAELPQLIGLKWASPSMTTFEKGLRLFAKRLCVIDNNFPFVYSHLLGARGINPHPSNYWPEWGVRLWGLLEAGKYREAQDEVSRVVTPYYDLSAEIERYTGGEGHLDKLCLELIGLGSSRCRPPTRDIRSLFRDKVRQMLLRCGVPRVR
ncbi:MAG TPA: dihydrodipicolinate synthase family protein, partial [Gemmataceae bacterium]|nr:dihydrodipicolinate synthase family protein [Gemmataceae bacterium]